MTTKIETHKLIPEPGSFKGDRKSFDNWWKRIKIYIAFNGGMTDKQKILAILSRMIEGPGGNWASARIDEVEAEELTDFASFIDTLITRFSDVTTPTEAKAQIFKLKQDRKSIDEFLDEFDDLKNKGNIGDEAAKFLLEQAINRTTGNAIHSREKIPSTYKEYFEAVRNIGRNIDSHNKATDTRTSSGTTFGGRGRAMEVDKVQSKRCYNCQRFGHIAKECRSPKKERKEFKELTCYNCGIKGHTANKCRKPKKGYKVRKVDEESSDEEETSKVEEVDEDFPKGSD